MYFTTNQVVGDITKYEYTTKHDNQTFLMCLKKLSICRGEYNLLACLYVVFVSGFKFEIISYKYIN